jgi:hypothetical protein
MATIAVFIALGGGAYAVTVPRNSVGPKQLKKSAVTGAKVKRGAITSAKIKDQSIGASDVSKSLFSGGVFARADDTDPAAAAGVTVRQAKITIAREGRIRVFATLRDPFVVCGDSPCSAHWGVYVDGKPVPDSGLFLDAGPDDGNGVSYHALFGETATPLPAGSHTVTLGRADSAGMQSVGELYGQLVATAPAG